MADLKKGDMGVVNRRILGGKHHPCFVIWCQEEVLLSIAFARIGRIDMKLNSGSETCIFARIAHPVLMEDEESWEAPRYISLNTLTMSGTSRLDSYNGRTEDLRPIAVSHRHIR